MRPQPRGDDDVSKSVSSQIRQRSPFPFPTLEKLSGNICPAGLRLNDEIFRGLDTRQDYVLAP